MVSWYGSLYGKEIHATKFGDLIEFSTNLYIPKQTLLDYELPKANHIKFQIPGIWSLLRTTSRHFILSVVIIKIKVIYDENQRIRSFSILAAR